METGIEKKPSTKDRPRAPLHRSLPKRLRVKPDLERPSSFVSLSDVLVPMLILLGCLAAAIVFWVRPPKLVYFREGAAGNKKPLPRLLKRRLGYDTDKFEEVQDNDAEFLGEEPEKHPPTKKSGPGLPNPFLKP